MNPAELFHHEEQAMQLQPGELLFSEGDAAEDMFVLLEGEVEITVGKRVVEVGQAGALLGEMALIENSPRSATVRAATACRFARITAERFAFLVQQTPFFSLHVMIVLADRLRVMNKCLAE